MSGNSFVIETTARDLEEEIKFQSSRLQPSRSAADAKLEVSRLPQWALKENSSAESLADEENGYGRQGGNYDNDWNAQRQDDTPLSFFSDARSPYPDKSPLRSLSVHVNAEPPATRGKFQDSSRSGVAKGVANRGVSGGRGDWELPGKTKKGSLMDLPVTFHSRVKSSGYGKADVQKNRWKQTKQGALRSKSAPRPTKNTDRTTVESRLRVYPKNCGLLTIHQPHNDYPPKVSNIPLVPILNVTFKEDGSLLGVVSGGNAVSTLKTPISRYKGEGVCMLLLYPSALLTAAHHPTLPTIVFCDAYD